MSFDKSSGSSSDKASRSTTQDLIKPHLREGVKRCVAVMSGKGGVGKSLVAALLAASLARDGFKTGILDADITGPSIPKMFGLKERASMVGTSIVPAETTNGIKVISLNLMLESEEMPVIWRGPLIAGTIRQFWQQSLWGKLDYLLVDLPPGTADAALTVMQSIPLDGLVVVASPQDLVVMIVKKAIHMARKLNIPILGVVENMSYAVCSKCGERLELFGEGRTPEVAASLGIEFLGRLPLDPQISRLCDQGEIEKYSDNSLTKATKAVINLDSRDKKSN